MSLRAQLDRLAERYDALSKRERAIVAGLIALVLVVLVQAVVVDPLNVLSGERQRNARQLMQQVSNMETELAAIRERHNQDPNRNEKARMASLQEQEADLDEQLRARMKGLIEPAQMAAVLEQVLNRKTPLQLYRVQSLEPEPLLAEDRETENNQDDETTQRQSGIFRHGMKIEFRGSYLATLKYLQALENLPWDFYWDGVELEVLEYPQAKVVITVHTLGLKEGWIGV